MKADETSTANTNVVHPRPSVFAQVKYLLLLEASYKAVCEKRDKIQYRWVQPPEREALQAIADGLAGEIMRTESNIIEGLKAAVLQELRPSDQPGCAPCPPGASVPSVGTETRQPDNPVLGAEPQVPLAPGPSRELAEVESAGETAVQEAESPMIPCRVCEGHGYLLVNGFKPDTCPKCEGRKVVRRDELV